MKYAVDCPRCGTVELTESEYKHQMLKVDSFWQCPKCRGNAQWNDIIYKSNFEENEQ